MSQRKQIVGVVVLCALAFLAGRMQAGEAVAQAQGSALTALDYQEMHAADEPLRVRHRHVLPTTGTTTRTCSRRTVSSSTRTRMRASRQGGRVLAKGTRGARHAGRRRLARVQDEAGVDGLEPS